MKRKCSKHGLTEHFARTDSNSYKCRVCSVEAVNALRKRHRQILVDEAGGKCVLCGYNKYIGALHFHHLDPTQKKFGLSGSGQTRSMAVKREEAAKCVLLCSNCHAEVEGKVTALNPVGG